MQHLHLRIRIQKIRAAEDLSAHLDAPLYADFDPMMIERHHADEHWLLLDAQGRPGARCSLWWSRVPAMERERLGLIGHFAADDETSALRLLEAGLAELARRGCTLAVGPMDGNTWHSYRFVTDAGTRPPFLMEPQNPPEYPGYFTKSGFAPLARYQSALCADLLTRDARIPGAIKRLRAAGVHWRPLDPARFEDELKAIYRLSLECFSHNFLYTPISEPDFMAQYRAVQAYINPELTLLAEAAGELVGYLFGIPDLLQARRGEPLDTFIIKTVAVRPGRRHAGLGSVLVAESQRLAREQGYRQVIHALMHETNSSVNISGHYAETMRRYTLFQKRLTGMP